MLSEEGIDQHPIATEGWTRENLVVLDEATGLQYRFGMPGPLMHEAEWERCLEMLAALDPAPAYLVASGSLPPGVPEDAYAQFARTAHDQGTRLIVYLRSSLTGYAARVGVPAQAEHGGDGGAGRAQDRRGRPIFEDETRSSSVPADARRWSCRSVQGACC